MDRVDDVLLLDDCPLPALKRPLQHRSCFSGRIGVRDLGVLDYLNMWVPEPRENRTLDTSIQPIREDQGRQAVQGPTRDGVGEWSVLLVDVGVRLWRLPSRPSLLLLR